MQWPNSVASARKNLRRAGTASNKYLTSTVVPKAPAAATGSVMPLSRLQACAASRVREVRVKCETAAIDAKASPRKPIESTDSSSASEVILLVAWRVSASESSSARIPLPSSMTAIRRMPPASSRTSIDCAPESTAFSTNSLRTEAGRSITSPAAIWLINKSGRGQIGRCVDMADAMTKKSAF